MYPSELHHAFNHLGVCFLSQKFREDIMAFFDDAEWLQSHIVNSFITSDDTGLLTV